MPSLVNKLHKVKDTLNSRRGAILYGILKHAARNKPANQQQLAILPSKRKAPVSNPLSLSCLSHISSWHIQITSLYDRSSLAVFIYIPF